MDKTSAKHDAERMRANRNELVRLIMQARPVDGAKEVLPGLLPGSVFEINDLAKHSSSPGLLFYRAGQQARDAR